MFVDTPPPPVVLPLTREAPAASSYSVALELRRGEEVLGAPRLTLADGAAAAVEVQGRYAVQVRVNRLVTASGPAQVMVGATLFLPEAGGWRPAGAGEALMTMGQPRTITFLAPRSAGALQPATGIGVTATVRLDAPAAP